MLLAQAVPEVPADPSADQIAAFARDVVHAAQDRDWGLLVGLVLMGLVWGLLALSALLARKADDKEWEGWKGWAGDRLRWLTTSPGRRAVAFVIPMLTIVGASLRAHEPMTGSLLSSAFQKSLIAAGGWSLIIEPTKDWIVRKFFAAKPAAAPVETKPVAPDVPVG